MTLPKAKDFSEKYSIEAKSRVPSPLKTCIHYYNDPNVIFLGGGLPRSVYFPWETVEATSAAVQFENGIIAANAALRSSLEQGSKDSSSTSHELSAAVGGGDIGPSDSATANTKAVTKLHRSPKTSGDIQSGSEDVLDIPLCRALQYGFSAGQPELLAFLKEHTALIHKPQYEDWDVFATIGNTSAWELTLRTFTNRGDVILAEEYSFSSSLTEAQAQGVTVVPVKLDDEGIVPEALESLMANWDVECKGLPRPKLLYTIPTGQNPTGTCLSAERRQQIYQIARLYDFLIVEDEPYYFLQMGAYIEDKSQRNHSVDSLDRKEFIDALVPSFLSLDVEGRVIRMDSFSKVLAPGVRLGWLVGSVDILEQYLRIQELSVQAPSGFSTAIINGTLRRWGQQGYIDWLRALRYEYTCMRDVAMDALYEFMPKAPFLTINPTIAGMFFTVTIDASAHPYYDTKFGRDKYKVEQEIFNVMISRGVLFVPGVWFHAKRPPSMPSIDTEDHRFFYRGTFAAVEPEKLVEGIRRLAEAIKEQFAV